MQRAVLHEWHRELRHADEGPAGELHREEESGLGAIDGSALEVFLGSKGNRVLKDIEPPPFLLDVLEYGVELAFPAEVQGKQRGGAKLAPAARPIQAWGHFLTLWMPDDRAPERSEWFCALTMLPALLSHHGCFSPSSPGARQNAARALSGRALRALARAPAETRFLELSKVSA